MADAPDTAPGKQQRNRGKKRKNLGKKHRAAKRRRKEREEEESREALAAQAPATHTVPPSGLSFPYAVYMNDSNNINFYLHPGGSAAKVEQGNPASTSSKTIIKVIKALIVKMTKMTKTTTTIKTTKTIKMTKATKAIKAIKAVKATKAIKTIETIETIKTIKMIKTIKTTAEHGSLAENGKPGSFVTDWVRKHAVPAPSPYGKPFSYSELVARQQSAPVYQSMSSRGSLSGLQREPLWSKFSNASVHHGTRSNGNSRNAVEQSELSRPEHRYQPAPGKDAYPRPHPTTSTIAKPPFNSTAAHPRARPTTLTIAKPSLNSASGHQDDNSNDTSEPVTDLHTSTSKQPSRTSVTGASRNHRPAALVNAPPALDMPPTLIRGRQRPRVLSSRPEYPSLPSGDTIRRQLEATIVTKAKPPPDPNNAFVQQGSNHKENNRGLPVENESGSEYLPGDTTPQQPRRTTFMAAEKRQSFTKA
ncbi:MAG: hypothetical protein MMC23_003775 [Stictis urceolatum]|nr:hypothetical protein [Stictis urceolata]